MASTVLGRVQRTQTTVIEEECAKKKPETAVKMTIETGSRRKRNPSRERGYLLSSTAETIAEMAAI